MLGFLGLYWGEGLRRSSMVGITNNDPGIIKSVLMIFNKYCPKKPKDIRIKCYPEHDKSQCKAFWERILGEQVKIEDKNWVTNNRRYYSKYGLCVVRFSQFEFRWRILTWIDLWRKSLLGADADKFDYRLQGAAKSDSGGALIGARSLSRFESRALRRG